MNDGCKIYVRNYLPDNPKGPTCVILSGLTRNAKDGHKLAMSIKNHGTLPCQVISIDYRGRGKSDYCHWSQYTVPREASDVADVMVALGIHKGVIIGTSRGGLVAMALGTMRPGLLSGVVLNDIGPELEIEGLTRIMSYVGIKPIIENWEDAERLTRAVNPDFQMSKEEWIEFTKRIYKEVDGKPTLDYDQSLGLSFKSMKPKKGNPIPTFWKLFDSLKNLPLLIIRGDRSDLFSSRVMSDMALSHGSAETLTVKNRGHAPFLDEPEVLPKIIALLKKSKI